LESEYFTEDVMGRRAGFGHDERFLLGTILLVLALASLLLGWPRIALAMMAIQVPLLTWYLFDYFRGRAP
jgi:hypothetical protein